MVLGTHKTNAPTFLRQEAQKTATPFFYNAEKSNFFNLVIYYAYGVPKEAYWFTDFRKNNFDAIYRTRRALLEFFAKKTLIFCFHQNRLLGYQKKHIDSLNKDSTML